MITEHILDAQFFNGNNAEAVDNTPCVLMAEVMPPIANALMDTSNDFTGFLAFTAPAFLLGEFALCFGERLFFLAEESRGVNKLAIGESRKGFQPNVNTDSFIGEREVIGLDLLAERGKPLAVDATDSAIFDFASRLAVEFGFYLAEFRKLDGAVSHSDYVRITDLEVLALRIGDAVVLSCTFNTWETWGFAFLYAVKKGIEGKVNSVRDILQDLAVNLFKFGVVFLPGGQVRLLREVAYRDFGGVILELPVVDEAVVNEAARFESGF